MVDGFQRVYKMEEALIFPLKNFGGFAFVNVCIVSAPKQKVEELF